MKAIVTAAVIAAASLAPSASRRPPQPTAPAEIVVVGTVHSPTARFTAATLDSIIKRVKPAVIMLELDPSFFDAQHHLLPA